MPASAQPLVVCIGMDLVQLVVIIVVTILETVVAPIMTLVAILTVIVIPRATMDVLRRRYRRYSQSNCRCSEQSSN